MSPEQVFSTPGRPVAIQLKTTNWHILRALLSLVSAALFLRIGGMVNQVVVSAGFGAGATMDAYFVALAFPLLLIQLISSAQEAAVIPVYSSLYMHADREAASRLLSTLVNCLVPCAVLLILVLIAVRQPVVFLSAPGLDSLRLHQAVILAPLLYLGVPFALVSSLLECVLNAEGQFGWPAYAGLLVPLTTVLFVLVGARTWGIAVLCIGSLAGTILQLIVVGVRVKQAHLRYHLVIDVRNPALRVILCASWPVLLGALITQGSPLIDQIFASTLPTGNISAFNYALKLVSVFIGVIFVSVGRALLPHLARQGALNDPGYQAFKGTLRLYLWGMGLCTLIGSMLLVFLGRPLVALLFQHGAFSPADTRNTASILVGFAPGLTPMALSFLLARAFNALGETRVPIYMALVNIGANAFFDALFAHFWQGLGIALATSAVSLVTSLLLLALLHRRIGTLQVWHVPLEIRALVTHIRFSRAEKRYMFRRDRFSWPFYASGPGQSVLYASVMLTALLVSVVATVRDALATLRVGIGLLLLSGLVRYPYILLLSWASLNVCIGSSLGIFNGSHLDMVLIFPLLCLLIFLPWGETGKQMPGLIWLALYLVWVFIGIGLSPLSISAFLTLWLTMLACIGIGVLTRVLITTRQLLLRLIDVLLATALLVAIYGLYGFVTHQRGEIDPGTSLFRVTSLFTQATTFAFYLSSLIPLAFYRCLFLRGVGQLIGVVATCCLLGVLLLTFTRAAYISVFLEALVMAFSLPVRRARILSVGGLALSCVVTLYLSWSGHLSFLARFFNEDLSTLNGRLYLWQALLSNFQVTHWLGRGLQSSDQLLTYLHVGTAGQGIIGTAPHSLFLGTLYDHGVIGLLLLSLAFLSLGCSLLRGIWRSGGEQRMLYATALASLVSILLQSLGSRDLWIQAAGASFWIVVALPFARCWPGSGPRLPEYQGRGSGNGLESPRIPEILPFCLMNAWKERFK